MTKDVLVTIKGIQFDIGYQDEVELITTGKYYLKGNKHYITYTEQSEDKDEGTTNTIKVSGDKLDILRHGSLNSHLIFEKNKKNMTYYETPVGTILIGIDTNLMHVNYEEDQMQIEVKYVLEVNYNYVADCNLSILIQGGDARSLHL